MRRILLPLTVVLAAAALPGAAQAAVVSNVSADTLNITGDAAPDSITLRLAPDAPGTLQVDTGGADFSFDRGTFTRISVRSGAGADDIRIDESNGAFTDAEATTIESGAGADLVVGGRGAEQIAAGDDADLVAAGAGDDALFLGAGDDTAVQASEDGFDSFDGQSGSDTLQTVGTDESEEFTVQAVGSAARISRDVGFARADVSALETIELRAGGGPDLVEGGAGTDFLRMNGSGANERFQVSSLGSRTILTRDVSAIRMDMGRVERLDVMPAGGSDTMVVDDMSGTDTEVVSWELAPVRGTTASDGAKDSVLINGSNGNDAITATAGGQQVRVAGLATVVDVTRADKSLDTLHVDTRLGNDSIFIAPQVHNLLTFTSS